MPTTIDKNFWRGKKVFLTGHTGFKGAWLLMLLNRLGAKVSGYALPPEAPEALFAAGGLETLCVQNDFADIRDSAALSCALQQAAPDIVIHMAAQSLVLKSYDDPLETFDVNVIGTAHLFQALRELPSVQVVLNVTSDKCYLNEQEGSGRDFHEDAPLGGDDPYSASKACAEIVTRAMTRSFFAGHPAAIATARAGNVIGGGDIAANRLVPDLIHALTKNEDIVLRMPGSIRPWQHVLNPLHGYLTLIQALWQDKDRYSGAWNFGPGRSDAVPVRTLCERLIGEWPSYAGRILVEKAEKPEANFLSLDIGKAHAELGWQPIWPLSKALTDIAVFQQRLIGGGDVRKTMGQTLDAYLTNEA